ncbi:hypothetical protein U1872_06455 [Sphingomonas sp. RB3P16]|uniref:hypothetical protein n=1 Tax=Parasphingomonas frigoris TaxID=3096163 RepID=UPI002FCA6C6D
MKKIQITNRQMYWLGRVAGYYVNNEGAVGGSRGCPENINPGRIDGGEVAARQLAAKRLIVWDKGYRMTDLGADQWNLHHPDHPVMVHRLWPTPDAEPKQQPTQCPIRPRRVIAPVLTIEEWRHLSEIFDCANDPVSARIFEKAGTMLMLLRAPTPAQP